MNKSDLKQIEEVLDNKLESIKQTLKEHTKKLDEHTSKLDALTLDMLHVQQKTDVIGDIHDMVRDTRETVANHQERLEALESAA